MKTSRPIDRPIDYDTIAHVQLIGLCLLNHEPIIIRPIDRPIDSYTIAHVQLIGMCLDNHEPVNTPLGSAVTEIYQVAPNEATTSISTRDDREDDRVATALPPIRQAIQRTVK